jgi:acylphosphatase
MSRAEVAAEVHVTGWVQGVAFRWTCRLEAERRGVRGWVRNEPDGSVRARFEGDRGPVDALVDWCRTGPSGARVEHLDVRDVEPSGLGGFEVRY